MKLFKTLFFISTISVALTFSSNVWSDKVLHGPPWSFLFGNHIDTHQESKLKKDGSLKGRLYIIFTGDIDPDSELPIARHPRGVSHNEVCGVDSIDCVVGWNFKAVPSSAKFLFHSGVNGNDHPVWLVNRVDIPQPGVYSHFHWIANQGPGTTDVRSVSVLADCDKDNASQLESQEPIAVNDICDGWFLQLFAIREFVFEHGGERIVVSPGLDISTHLNLVSNYAEVEGITATRGGGH